MALSLQSRQRGTYFTIFCSSAFGTSVLSGWCFPCLRLLTPDPQPHGFRGQALAELELGMLEETVRMFVDCLPFSTVFFSLFFFFDVRCSPHRAQQLCFFCFICEVNCFPFGTFPRPMHEGIDPVSGAVVPYHFTLARVACSRFLPSACPAVHRTITNSRT